MHGQELARKATESLRAAVQLEAQGRDALNAREALEAALQVGGSTNLYAHA